MALAYEDIQYCPYGNVFSTKEYRNDNRPVKEGSPVCNPSESGYQVVFIDRNRHFAHRIAFEKMGVEIPKGMFVDHIDGDKSNNRWNNLRLVTKRQNAQNRDSHRGGCKVGTYKTSENTYQAQIAIDKKPQNLGIYHSLELAEQAYLAKLKDLGEPKPLHTDQKTWDECPKFEEIYEKRNTRSSWNRHKRVGKGYSYCEKRKKYRSKITVNGRGKHLGDFQTAEEAREAYLKAKKEYVK